MKIINKMFMCLVTLCMLAPSSVFATENQVEVSNLFKDYISEVMEIDNSDDVCVFNSLGDNITNEFYNINRNNYYNNDFKSIKEYVSKNVVEMYIMEESNSSNLRSPFVTNAISKRYYKEVHKNQASGEIVYHISGSYVWDRATGKITSKSNGAISLEKVNFGSGWSYSVTNMSTSSSLDGSKTKATFSGNFRMKVSFAKSYVTVFNIDLGTFSGSVSGTPHEN